MNVSEAAHGGGNMDHGYSITQCIRALFVAGIDAEEFWQLARRNSPRLRRASALREFVDAGLVPSAPRRAGYVYDDVATTTRSSEVLP